MKTLRRIVTRLGTAFRLALFFLEPDRWFLAPLLLVLLLAAVLLLLSGGLSLVAPFGYSLF